MLLTVTFAVRQSAEQRLQQATIALSQQLVGQLMAELEKHRYLPELLAQNPAARALLESPNPEPAAVTAFNQTLETANRIATTADIYLMRADGMTLAASNWNTDASFIGRNFSFRQYFQQAIHGQLGRYYALGTTSKKRGYYFAHAVNDSAGKPLGVMVVKVDINTQEAQWKQENADFMVTDRAGVVFMSSNSDWRLHSLQPLDASTRAV
jgi:two-component system C4-dicarboxylate transport sensor histidine kinase DctB